MSFKKIFSLALSLLTINSANLCVSAMGPKVNVGASVNAGIKERKSIKVKFTDPENFKECIVLVPYGELLNGGWALLDKIGDDGKVLPCCICNKPMYYGDYFSIFKHEDIYVKNNLNKDIEDPENIRKSTEIFMRLLPCCFHYNCGTKQAIRSNNQKIKELDEKNKNKSPENFTSEDINTLISTATKITNCPKCGRTANGHYDFGVGDTLGLQLISGCKIF